MDELEKLRKKMINVIGKLCSECAWNPRPQQTPERSPCETCMIALTRKALQKLRRMFS